MKRNFLGIQFSKAPNGYRWRRFLAFVIDVAVMLAVVFVVYKLTGKPDYPEIAKAMRAIQAMGDTDNTQAMMSQFFTMFDGAYIETLVIWFFVEAVSQIALRGATLGKLAMGLRIRPANPNRGWPLHFLLMSVRSLIKMFFIYLFQGLPFLIALLSILVTQNFQAGYDVFVKTYVEDAKVKKE